jgi:hypothetical protein
MTSKEIRAMNFNATWNQYFDLLQEIAARMAERDERTPAPEATETPTERDLFCVWWDKNASDSEGMKNLDLYTAQQTFHAGWNAAKGEVPAAPEAAVTAITDAQWDALCRDIQDRRGLKWEWNKIDDDVKLGIRRAWSAILSNVPAPETAGAAPPSDAVTRDVVMKACLAYRAAQNGFPGDYQMTAALHTFAEALRDEARRELVLRNYVQHGTVAAIAPDLFDKVLAQAISNLLPEVKP